MTLRLAIFGFGVVGQGLAGTLERKRAQLASRGIDLELVAVADSKGVWMDEGGIAPRDAIEKKRKEGTVAMERMRPERAVRDMPCDVVVDTTPTNIEDGEPGMSIMLSAFESGKHVVTSNKGPLALEFRTLSERADECGVHLLYEASVGGAMPIFNLARCALAPAHITSIEGIFNGTCNYILTRMRETGYSYADILNEARELGIAEADPTYDVEGIDAACKVAILANALFGMDVCYRDVSTTGISQITPEAIHLAAAGDFSIKLIGKVSPRELRVAPMLVPTDHPLNVGGTLNVASIATDIAGTITVMGRGAGAVETASALLSDIVWVYRSVSP